MRRAAALAVALALPGCSLLTGSFSYQDAVGNWRSEGALSSEPLKVGDLVVGTVTLTDLTMTVRGDGSGEASANYVVHHANPSVKDQNGAVPFNLVGQFSDAHHATITLTCLDPAQCTTKDGGKIDAPVLICAGQLDGAKLACAGVSFTRTR